MGKTRIVLLGAPGVGKGTVAGMLADSYRLPHISTGDMFKEAIRKGTKLGLKVKAFVEAGNLVPDGMVNELVSERLLKRDARKGFFLDGYPRTVEQAKAMGAFAKPDLVLNFSADRETIIERLSGRRVCGSCGAIFHVKNMPPEKEGVCDNCGSKLIMRKDDNPSVVKNRLDVYEAQTRPLIDYYSKKGLLVSVDSNHNINEIGRIIEQCDAAIEKVKKGQA